MSSASNKAWWQGPWPLLGGGAFLLCALVVFVLLGLRDKKKSATHAPSQKTGTAGEAAETARNPGARSVQGRNANNAATSAARAAGQPGTQAMPEHHIPAQELSPPGPGDPVEVKLVMPPDPATHRPPMANPGGVNGDRPPRELLPPAQNE